MVKLRATGGVWKYEGVTERMRLPDKALFSFKLHSGKITQKTTTEVGQGRIIHKKKRKMEGLHPLFTMMIKKAYDAESTYDTIDGRLIR